MVIGILSGLLWAVETVVMGIALDMAPFISTPQAIALAPFVATFLHDGVAAVLLLCMNAARGKLKPLLRVAKSRDFKWLLLASAIGGPIGMTGYVMCVNYMGPSVGAVASAVYPAVGTVLAFFFLKEKVKWYQWIFLCLTLLGVYGLSYSPTVNIENFWLGLLGAFMCSFGWGTEAVILAKCMKDPAIKSEFALNIRQAVSALIYGIIILPLLGGWDVVPQLFTFDTRWAFPAVAAAGFFAAVSCLFYYRAIAKIGASKAMALNVTYTAWAILFSFIFLGDKSILSPLTMVCAAVVVVCGIMAGKGSHH